MFKIGSNMISKWIKDLEIDKISCVIPTFNRPELLQTSLDYLIANKFSFTGEKIDLFNLELIIVDDGSNDYESSLNKEICDHYSVFNEKEIEIKYIKLDENSGTVSIPRNIGISHISGRTIAPVDDDCLCLMHKLKTLYETLYNEYDEALLAFGDRAESTYKDEIITPIRGVSAKNQNPKEVGLDNGQFIYKADVYNYIKPVFAINACDWELYKQIAEFGKFNYVSSVVCNYLWHNNNISILKPKPMRVNPYDVLGKYKKYFKDGPFKDKIFVNN